MNQILIKLTSSVGLLVIMVSSNQSYSSSAVNFSFPYQNGRGKLALQYPSVMRRDVCKRVLTSKLRGYIIPPNFSKYLDLCKLAACVKVMLQLKWFEFAMVLNY